MLVGQIIRISFTRYIVDESSIEMRFNFLTNKHNAFSVEKITWVIVRQSFIDKWFWLCSIQFRSIGSSSNITFYGVRKTTDLEEKILSKVWMKKDEKPATIPVDFGFWNYIKSSIWLMIFLLVFLLSTIIPLVLFSANTITSSTEMITENISKIEWLENVESEEIINSVSEMYDTSSKMFYLSSIFILAWFIILFFLVFWYKKIFYAKKRYIQRVHKDFIESISGIFFINKYYSLFRHIKWIHSKKYPLTQAWTLTLDVAWEQLVQQWNNPPQLISNHISIHYLWKVKEIHDEIDEVLKEKKLNVEVLKKSKQEIANSIIWMIILALVCTVPFISIPWAKFAIIPTAIFFVIIILWIVWFIKVKSFVFEKDRIVYYSGIIYKSKRSILYEKINFIEKNQWMVNKIFKNGSVNIYTIWSGRIEMKLSDMGDYFQVYDLLKKD